MRLGAGGGAERGFGQECPVPVADTARCRETGCRRRTGRNEPRSAECEAEDSEKAAGTPLGLGTRLRGGRGLAAERSSCQTTGGTRAN